MARKQSVPPNPYPVPKKRKRKPGRQKPGKPDPATLGELMAEVAKSGDQTAGQLTRTITDPAGGLSHDGVRRGRLLDALAENCHVQNTGVPLGLVLLRRLRQ